MADRKEWSPAALVIMHIQDLSLSWCYFRIILYIHICTRDVTTAFTMTVGILASQLAPILLVSLKSPSLSVLPQNDVREKKKAVLRELSRVRMPLRQQVWIRSQAALWQWTFLVIFAFGYRHLAWPALCCIRDDKWMSWCLWSLGR